MSFSRQEKGRSFQKPGEGAHTHRGVQGPLPRAEVPGDLRDMTQEGEAGLPAVEFQTPWAVGSRGHVSLESETGHQREATRNQMRGLDG